MEKCHPLQEGLARSQLCVSLLLHPRRPRPRSRAPPGAPTRGRSGSVATPRPPGLRLRGSRARGRDSGMVSLVPSGEPAQVPQGWLRPGPLGGNGRGRGLRASEGGGRKSRARTRKPRGARAAPCAPLRPRKEPGQTRRAGGSPLLGAATRMSRGRPDVLRDPLSWVQRPRPRLPGWARGPEAGPAP